MEELPIFHFIFRDLATFMALDNENIEFVPGEIAAGDSKDVVVDLFTCEFWKSNYENGIGTSDSSEISVLASFGASVGVSAAGLSVDFSLSSPTTRDSLDDIPTHKLYRTGILPQHQRLALSFSRLLGKIQEP
jgi:hypothetical protein